MDWSNVIYIALVILLALVDVFLIPWLKTKVDTEKLNKFLSYVKMVVQAAEQIFGAGAGEEKKNYVIKALADAGFKYDSDTVNNAIESAVLELK